MARVVMLTYEPLTFRKPCTLPSHSPGKTQSQGSPGKACQELCVEGICMCGRSLGSPREEDLWTQVDLACHPSRTSF